MGIEIASAFERKSTVPIDETAYVADLTARDAIDAGIRFDGFIVYVEAEGKNYQLVGGITNGDWTELSSGGSTSSFEANITAFAGGGQGSAYQIDSYINQIETVATTGDSVKLPAATAGREIVIINDGANDADVFPATGEDIDGLGVNTAYELPAGSNARFICAVTGEWKSAAGGGGSGESVVFGSIGSPRSIVAGTGIVAASSHMSTVDKEQDVFVVGSVADTICDISANPQIEAGTIVGQEMNIHGTSDSAPVLLEDGNGLKLNGARLITNNTLLCLRWNGSVWFEKSWTGA